MKKRYVLKNKRKFMVTLAITISILGSVFLFATTRTEGFTEITYKEVVINSGDTLWGIVAETYGNNVDIRRKVADIRKANEMENSELFVGQVLLIPEN
jgi:nucleoid-associated protein YgaU